VSEAPARPVARPAAEPAARPTPVAANSDKPVKANRRVLTVGNDIILRGEVTTCDRLVIEGKVDAKISDVHTVEIAETGSFKGQAEVEEAEISGTFDGDIVVRGRLVIYSTGKVRGSITYGEIEIERGGEISGEIKTMASASSKSGSKPYDKAA
jgi:cytoskeletal protein CcmA (bactofilin family)